MVVALCSGSGRMVTIVVVALVLAGLAIRAGVWCIPTRRSLASPPGEGWAVYLGRIYYPTYARVDGLLVGVLLATVRRFRPERWNGMMARGDTLLVSGLIVLTIAYVALANQMGFVSCVFGFPLLAIGFGLITAAALSPTSLFQKFRVPGAQTLALLSYAMYLTHTEAIHASGVLAARLGVPVTSVWFSMFTIVVIISFAAALYILVEKPALRLRDMALRDRPQRVAAGDASESALL